MTHKYESECWSCGSKNMEKLDTYVKCKDCGATWNEVLESKKASRGVAIYETKTVENSRSC